MGNKDNGELSMECRAGQRDGDGDGEKGLECFACDGQKRAALQPQISLQTWGVITSKTQ